MHSIYSNIPIVLWLRLLAEKRLLDSNYKCVWMLPWMMLWIIPFQGTNCAQKCMLGDHRATVSICLQCRKYHDRPGRQLSTSDARDGQFIRGIAATVVSVPIRVYEWILLCARSYFPPLELLLKNFTVAFLWQRTAVHRAAAAVLLPCC